MRIEQNCVYVLVCASCERAAVGARRSEARGLRRGELLDEHDEQAVHVRGHAVLDGARSHQAVRLRRKGSPRSSLISPIFSSDLLLLLIGITFAFLSRDVPRAAPLVVRYAPLPYTQRLITLYARFQLRVASRSVPSRRVVVASPAGLSRVRCDLRS